MAAEVPRPRRLLPMVGAVCAAAVLALPPTGCLEGQSDEDRVLLLVVDGLRPDYVTPRLMPRLDALARRGVRGTNHHAVFPTVTRVNGPAIFTGRHPGGNGLLGNAVYMPEVDGARVLGTGDAANLRAIDRATGGRLLTAPSLGELLAERGLVLFAASSGSTGSATLMNHRGAGAGLVHDELTLPDTLAAVVRTTLGPVPPLPEGASELPLVARAVDAVLRIGVDRADADVLAVWLSEPDGTAHDYGIGSSEVENVLRGVDAEIGRLLDGLADRGILGRTNILVTSDHGFSTRVGKQSLEELLVEADLKASETSLDVVVAGDAIHVREGGDERVTRIVRLLQTTPWVGPVFTRAASPGSWQGTVPGTLAFDVVAWDHERSADILISSDWSDAPNAHGYRGAALVPGVAGHGTTSPWDIRATFIAAGPAVKRGIDSAVPTGNIDLTPTTLHLLGLPVEGLGFDGRVLRELLVEGPDPRSVDVLAEPVSASVELDDLIYRVTVDRSRVGGTVYVDGTRVERRRIGRDKAHHNLSPWSADVRGAECPRPTPSSDGCSLSGPPRSGRTAEGSGRSAPASLRPPWW